MKAYLNGQFVDLQSATVSLHDAGLQHGVGLFETMRAYRGRVFRLENHMQRLIRSAKELGLTERLRLDPLCELVEVVLKENDLADARLRLTLTGGELSLLGAARQGGQTPSDHQPSVFIVPSQPTEYPQDLFELGVRAIVADPRANPFDPMAGHKTLNYWSRLRTLTAAASVQAGEALWFSVTNHLVGGAVSNAFLVKDNQLLTPIAHGEEQPGALPSPVLPGITRATVIECADSLGLSVQRKMLTLEDVYGAEEMFLTNASWHVLPVVQVEQHAVGEGAPGPVTARLRQAVLERIAQECP